MTRRRRGEVLVDSYWSPSAVLGALVGTAAGSTLREAAANTRSVPRTRPPLRVVGAQRGYR